MNECNKCNGTLFVCENHPDQEAHQCKDCGGAGMPCECTKMSKPIGNTEQLPVAWFYEDDEIKGVSLYKENFCVDAIPLYAHPMRELTDEEIIDAMCLNDTDLMVVLEITLYAKEKMIQRGRALLKKASEK